MPFQNSNAFQFSPQGLTNAPALSGVYGIFNQERWIYVGETGDINRRLAEHLNTGGTCIHRYFPTGFTYELSPQLLRVARQDQLIQQLAPACNQRFG